MGLLQGGKSGELVCISVFGKGGDKKVNDDKSKKIIISLRQ
jgi:hypothetical protein